MKFEGNQVNIPIKGIMRAGTDELCADGAMNEVIGMEYKDGSWLPYVMTNEGVIFTDMGLDGGIKKVYVHKTSDGESHYVVISTNNSLFYEVDRIGSDKIISCSLLTDSVKDIEFIGNMLCVSKESGMEYYIWKDGSYGNAINDECPDVEIRTTLGMNSDVSDSRVGVVHCQKILGEKTSNDIEQVKEDVILKTAQSGIVAALGETRDRGGLTGYFLASVAYRLKNGELVNASVPILLGRPAVSTGEKEYNLQSEDGSFDNTDRDRNEDYYAVYERFWLGAKIDRDESDLRKDGVNELEIRTGDSGKYCAVCGNPSPVNPINTIVLSKKLNFYGNDGPISKEEWNLLRMEGEFSYTGESNLWYPLAPTAMCAVVKNNMWYGGFRVDNYFNSIVISNKLQYRIKSLPDSINDSNVQSICVFISPEVSPYFFDTYAEYDDTLFQSNKHKGLFAVTDNGAGVLDFIYGVRTIYARYRGCDDIIKELRNISSMYLVKEIPISEITPSDEWITINLKGLLGETLVTREQLPLTAYPYGKTIGAKVSSYNYRLHQYDYSQEIYKGDDLVKFYHHGGEFQYPQVEEEATEQKWEIEVDIIDNEGNHSVVNYDTESVQKIICSLTPILSYPNVYAKKMTIRMYKVSDGETYVKEREFALSPITTLGISCYIDPELKPIIIFDDSSTQYEGDFPTLTPSGELENYHNGLKVSDVAYPSYFPAKYTYRIGNEKIIGLARLTIPVSQDNYGVDRLIVFCSDGIYSMGVDRTGAGVYTDTQYVDPEVCVNKNTICEIGGAIIFASDKGLMILSSNGVEEFTPHLNGKIQFKPSDSAVSIKDGYHIYNKIVTHDEIVELKDSLSTEDFIDYIGNTDTVVSYVSNKNKIVIYNKLKPYIYLIDIKTRNITKLDVCIDFDDDNSPEETYWVYIGGEWSPIVFGYLSDAKETDCLIQSRPIKIQQDDKCSYRCVLTGYFEGNANSTKWAELVVLGSLDGDHWRAIGIKERKLNEPFHNFGCITERGSWKYIMFIFAGRLNSNSHIDSIDITVEGKYNNKKR